MSGEKKASPSLLSTVLRANQAFRSNLDSQAFVCKVKHT